MGDGWILHAFAVSKVSDLSDWICGYGTSVNLAKSSSKTARYVHIPWVELLDDFESSTSTDECPDTVCITSDLSHLSQITLQSKHSSGWGRSCRR